MFLVFSDFELNNSLRSLLLITVGIYLLCRPRDRSSECSDISYIRFSVKLWDGSRRWKLERWLLLKIN